MDITDNLLMENEIEILRIIGSKEMPNREEEADKIVNFFRENIDYRMFKYVAIKMVAVEFGIIIDNVSEDIDEEW